MAVVTCRSALTPRSKLTTPAITPSNSTATWTRVELFKVLKEGKIGPEEEEMQIEIITADFGRDLSVKESNT